MNQELLDLLLELNPWLVDASAPIFNVKNFIVRSQVDLLLDEEWDQLCTVIVGPRQAGKTTISLYLAQQLLAKGRFEELIYLNCDVVEIRQWLRGLQFVREAIKQFNLKKPILFIDEAQRLENPGLLLKAIIDLRLPIKLMVSGSSQLEIKSTIQEHLTGRSIEVTVLPLSWHERVGAVLEQSLLFGCYPKIILSKNRRILLDQLYKTYINKDIIEILRIGKPDVMQKLIGLVAHCSGQLVNYNQLSTDCRVSAQTIQSYLSILEKTYIIRSIKPFVGNKRTEITSNPIYYFVDNGFRNQALNNFSSLNARTDLGLLVENFVFQELLKYKTDNFDGFEIHFWRTKAGAEVDFIIYKNSECIIPVEVKYQNMRSAKITRSLRSYLQAYRPTAGIVITKSFIDTVVVEGCDIHFIPFPYFNKALDLLSDLLV